MTKAIRDLKSQIAGETHAREDAQAAPTKMGGADAQNGRVHYGRRTNAGKAADVLSMLKSNPELADREIARRVGVSPQTVNNWRTRLARGTADAQ